LVGGQRQLGQIKPRGHELAHEKGGHMATAYVILDAGSFELAYQGTGIDTDHTIGFDAANVKADKEAVLVFDVNPGNDDDISVTWTLNGTDILNQGFSSTDARAWQAVVPKNLLKANGNKLTAKLSDTDATGSISFGDLVLTYTLKS
jgi:hypothetical protein